MQEMYSEPQVTKLSNVQSKYKDLSGKNGYKYQETTYKGV